MAVSMGYLGDQSPHYSEWHSFPGSILSLRALDEHVISDEEIIENLRLWGKFEHLTAHFRLSPYQLGRKVHSVTESV